MNASFEERTSPLRVAIQGELGSNSHMAVLALLAAGPGQPPVEIVPCAVSAEVLTALVAGSVDAAVLPIENSLHGSVAEHYDLLLTQPVAIVRESLLRIRHNLIAAPGVSLGDLRFVLSHPVALSQCRGALARLAAPTDANRAGVRAMPFYDTAGSVKHLMENRLTDTAALAPALAAEQYGAQILLSGLEDHEQNFTRFHLLRRERDLSRPGDSSVDKMSLAFALEHRPGTLVAALQALARAGVDLTQIESRPVPGRPWEYVFYVDLRLATPAMADEALAVLTPHCTLVKELGRYPAATPE